MKRPFLTALTASALLAAPAPALAQGAPPAPGCFGVQVTDKAGDSVNGLDSSAGSPSSDLIAGWISTDGAKAFANIQVDHLTEGEVDVPYVAVGWEFMMTTAAGQRFVRAYHDRTGITKYTWGEPRVVTEDPVGSGIGGTTTGTLFPGKGGVIQIELPVEDANFGAKPGTVLKGFALEVRQWISLPAAVPNTGLPLVSPAPIYDEAAGKGTVTLGPCPSAPAPGAPADPASPAPGSGGGGEQAAGGRVAPQVEYTVKPGRDAKPPFKFRTDGRLIPPDGVSRSDACKGRVSVQVKRGKRTVSNRRVGVRPDCTFRQTVKFTNRKRLGKARSLRWVVTFQGNKVLLPQKTKARTVRVR